MRALLLVALLAAPAAAQLDPSGMGWKAIQTAHWGGLDLLNDTTMIDGDCQDCQNVLTDNSYLEKRPGNVLLTTILPGSPVTYVNDWTSPSGTRFLVAQASNTVYQTNFSGAAVVLSSAAAGYNLTATAAFSKLFFADGSRPLWYWDGNSTGTVTDPASGAVAPICTYTVFKDNRLFCANIPNASSSQVDVSSAGGANYWQVQPNAASVDNAANAFLFTPDDGDAITCLAATPWGVFVGKKASSYVIKGNGNLSYDPRLLDPRIGCVDNRSVQMVYGVLEWLALDGVYGYDGSGPPHLLTRELDPLMKQVRQGLTTEGQWATQLQPDWASGTESTTTANLPAQGPWDFNTVPGEIFPSSGTLYDDNRSPLLQGGVGFASDTLVNVDTTSFPLSIGLAQVAPSSSGVQVWLSSYPLGNYTTLATTWTVSAGGMSIANNTGQFPGFGSGGIGGTALTSSIYTTAASSGALPDVNGWHFGYWSIGWMPATGVTGPASYGSCGNGVTIPSTCFEFDFMADRPTNLAWSGYGVRVQVQASCNGPGGGGGGGGNCPYTAQIVKSISGVSTVIGNAGSFVLPMTSGFVGFSTVAVSRTPGGYFTVFFGTTPIANAQDSTGVANKAVVSSLTLYDYQGNVGGTNAAGVEAVFLNELQGFGSGSILSRVVDTGMGAPLAGVLSSSYTLQGLTNIAKPETELDFYVRDSTSPNNDLWSSWQASSNGVTAVLPLRYWQYEALFTTRVSSYTPQLASVSLAAVATGYYYSKVNFVGPNITSWKQFAVTETNPGTYGYAVRAATYNFLPQAAAPAWVAQTANQNVNLSVSTPTYAQYRLDSTGLANASLAEPISAVFVRWQEGANIPVASAALDRRYYLCVTVSTAATTPDTCLIRQKTGKWVFWRGPTVGAMGLYNYNIVVADGASSSKVWKIMQPGVYNDDGAPINAYWISADFTDNLIFNNKVLHELWVDAAPVAQSSVTVSYQTNKNPGWNDVTVNLDNGQAPLASAISTVNPQYGDINQWVQLQAGTAVGKYLRVKFADAQADDYFRVNDYLLYVEDQQRQTP